MKTFKIILALAILGIIILLVKTELQKPIDYEALRVQECEVKLGGTQFEDNCNNYYIENFGDKI